MRGLVARNHIASSVVSTVRSYGPSPKESLGSRAEPTQITRHFTQRALAHACPQAMKGVDVKGVETPAPCFARLRGFVNNRNVMPHFRQG